VILTVHQYRDRIAAGRTLAQHLVHYANRVDTVVLALPRGGVPVALQVAEYLNAPLDVFLVRKLGQPDNPEIAMGAIASGDVRVLDEFAIAEAGISKETVAEVTARERDELERRQKLYRGNRPRLDLAGRIAILVDDGMATGFSMHAAVVALHQQRPAWLVVATPVGSPEACDELAEEVHELVCPLRPEPFRAVGLWYDHFANLTDDDVREGLRHAAVLPRM
jgi:putative phosphoribosyl transferase